MLNPEYSLIRLDNAVGLGRPSHHALYVRTRQNPGNAALCRIVL